MPETLKVNRVDIGSTTLIDISDTTAIASDVASGKYFYLADGNKVTGTASGGAISVVDTTDAGGGTIRTISGVPAPEGKITISENGTDIDVAQYALADVAVSGGGDIINLQDKTVTPSNITQYVTADSSAVTVEDFYMGNMAAQTATTTVEIPHEWDLIIGKPYHIETNNGAVLDVGFSINSDFVFNPPVSVDFSPLLGGQYVTKVEITSTGFLITFTGDYEWYYRIGNVTISTEYNGLGTVTVNPAGSTQTYTATFIGSRGGNVSCYVIHDGITYTNKTGSFTFSAGDTLTCHRATDALTTIYIGNKPIAHGNDYTFNLPASDIEIELYYGSEGYINIFILDPTSVPYEIEEGVWIPEEDVWKGTINFEKTHSQLPAIACVVDANGDHPNTTYTNMACTYNDYSMLPNSAFYETSTALRYGMVSYASFVSSKSTLVSGNTILFYPSTSEIDTSSTYPRFWVTESCFMPNVTSYTTERLWRAGRRYKWSAIWTPYL